MQKKPVSPPPPLCDGDVTAVSQPPIDPSTATTTPAPRGSGILMPNASPVAHKMQRRFYHLGVERTDLPPRDSAALMGPDCIAYMPPVAVGRDPAHEFHRAMEFNASGAPPPKPKYFSDIDRCKHFVHPRGGMDVGPHLVNRPSYKLSTGDYPHTSMLKDMLSINAAELTSLRRSRSQQSPSSPSRRCPSGLQDPLPLAPSPSGGTVGDDGLRGDGDGVASSASTGAPSHSRMWGTAHDGGSFDGAKVRSMDVAKRSSLVEATARTRRFNVLLDRERQLRQLTRMGHPNQITNCGSRRGDHSGHCQYTWCMLHVSRRLCRKHQGSWLPKQYRNLPSSLAGKKWGNIGRLSNAVVNDVLSGSWRDVHETVLADNTVREPYENPHGGGATSHASVMEQLSFKTDEDAQAFMTALSEREEEDRNVPLMALTKAFYEDLARTAGDEIDVEGDALEKEASKTDEERAEEARHVQREFFADFYVAQGCIAEPQRDAFLRTMLSPPRSFLVPEPNIVLSRLVLRQQLEVHHSNAAAERHSALLVPVPWMDGVSEILAASQGQCSSDSATMRLLPLAAPPIATLPTSAESVDDAMRLFDAMTDNDVQPTAAPVGDIIVAMGGTSTSAAATDVDALPNHDSGSAPTLFDGATAHGELPVPAPSGPWCDGTVEQPSLVQLRWLQRVVSTGAAIDCDLMGLMIPLLLDVRPHDTVASYVDADGQRMGNGDLGGDYVLDVVRWMRHERWMRALEDDTSDVAPTMGTMLTLHRPAHDGGAAREQQSLQRNDLDVDALLGLDTNTPVRSAAATSRAMPPDAHAVHLSMPTRSAVPPPDLPIHSVLCCPRNSGDGIRPRVLLSSDPRAEGRSAPNRAFDVIRNAARHFSKAKHELIYGLSLLSSPTLLNPTLHHAESGSPQRLGRASRLVFAVNSMNPVECEAVVCAALLTVQHKTHRLHDRRFRVVPVQQATAHLGCEEACRRVLGGLVDGWGNGLTEWMPTDAGAPGDSDARTIPEALRQDVGRASWRLRPSRDGCNGGFVCVIERVEDLRGDENSRESGGGGDVPRASDGPTPPPASAPMADAAYCVASLQDTRSTGIVQHGQHGLDTPCLLHRDALNVLRKCLRDSDDGPQPRPHVLQAGAPLSARPMERGLSTVVDLALTATEECHLLCALGYVPSVRINITMLLALLYVRSFTLSAATQCLAYLDIRSRSGTQDGQHPVDSGAAHRELLQFVEAVDAFVAEHSGDAEDVRRDRGAMEKSLLLTLAPPSTDSNGMWTVHPWVASECNQLCVVAHVQWGDGASWQLRVDGHAGSDALPSGAAASDAGTAEERLIATRDALCYVNRMLRLPTEKGAVLGHYGIVVDVPPPPHRQRPHNYVDQDQRGLRHNAATGKQRDGRDVGARRHRYRLQRIARKLRSVGAEVGDEGPNDWAADVRHGRGGSGGV